MAYLDESRVVDATLSLLLGHVESLALELDLDRDFLPPTDLVKRTEFIKGASSALLVYAREYERTCPLGRRGFLEGLIARVEGILSEPSSAPQVSRVLCPDCGLDAYEDCTCVDLCPECGRHLDSDSCICLP